MPWCMTHADQGVDLLKNAVEVLGGVIEEEWGWGRGS